MATIDLRQGSARFAYGQPGLSMDAFAGSSDRLRGQTRPFLDNVTPYDPDTWSNIRPLQQASTRPSHDIMRPSTSSGTSDFFMRTAPNESGSRVISEEAQDAATFSDDDVSSVPSASAARGCVPQRTQRRRFNNGRHQQAHRRATNSTSVFLAGGLLKLEVQSGPVTNLMKLSLEMNNAGGYTKENAPAAMLELEAKGRIRRQRAATKKISILDDVDTYLAEERLLSDKPTILAQGTGQSEEVAGQECAWDAVQKLFKRDIIAEASVEFTSFTRPPHPDANVRSLIAASESDFEAMLSILGV